MQNRPAQEPHAEPTGLGDGHRVATLPPESAAALDVLLRVVATHAPLTVPRELLRSTARAVAGAAQRELMPPEQLIVALKETWCSHPDFRRGGERHSARSDLADFVSMCISEYYLAAPTRPVWPAPLDDGGPSAAEAR